MCSIRWLKNCKKSAERNRALKNKFADIEFDENMPLKIGQEKFLTNNKNKSRLRKLGEITTEMQRAYSIFTHFHWLCHIVWFFQ